MSVPESVSRSRFPYREGNGETVNKAFPGNSGKQWETGNGGVVSHAEAIANVVNILGIERVISDAAVCR